MKDRWNRKCIICMLPGIAGTLVFFVIPYIRMLYYSVIDNQFRRNFAGLSNYIKTIGSVKKFVSMVENNSFLV
ncbi:MAG: hypothetical protein OSJ45_15580, partial [Lachnospiraceae bacterium]|nr:hypothetical protein [Lachnospiraceae bacterium]